MLTYFRRRLTRTAPHSVQEVTADDIRAAYRIILDREPDIGAHTPGSFQSMRALRDAFLTSEEFQRNFPLLSPRLDAWVIKESVHGFRIHVSLSDLHVCRNILLDSYEEAEVSAIKSILQPGQSAIDIGANIGFYTLLFAKLVGRHGKVLGFEALPFLAAAARRSVHENSFDDICTVHSVALSDSEGTARFRHAANTVNFGGGHLAPDEATPVAHTDIEVPMARLDDFITDRRWAFIKIDVEGAEPKVFRGGTTLIQRDRPIILSELLNPQLKRVSGMSANELIRWMQGIGYSCVELGSRQPIAGYQRDEPINVLFLPNAA